MSDVRIKNTNQDQHRTTHSRNNREKKDPANRKKRTRSNFGSMEDPPSDAETENSMIPAPPDAVHVKPSAVVAVSDSDNDCEIQGHVVVSDSDDDSEIQDQHDIMEFFSPKRVIAEAKKMKVHLRGEYAFDIATSGHDFRKLEDRLIAKRLMVLHQVHMACLSPPCTMFSDLWNMWNVQKCDPSVYHERLETAKGMIYYSMDLAKLQHAQGRWFFYEQPHRASSWQLPEVEAVVVLPRVWKSTFDMCCFGMKSPFGKAVRKRTTVMTNNVILAGMLCDKFCKVHRRHRTVQGSEGGHAMSKWCQVYPPGFCRAVVRSMADS